MAATTSAAICPISYLFPKSAGSAHRAKIFSDKPGSGCARAVPGENTFILALFENPSQPFRFSVCAQLATRRSPPLALGKW
jgi:hypothetical protein